MTNLTMVITLKTPHTMTILIRRSLVNLKRKQLVLPQLNSLVLSPKCIVTSKIMKKGEKTAKGIKKNSAASMTSATP